MTKIRQVVLIVTFFCLAINLMTMESAASQVDEEKILRETKGWVFPSDGVVTDIFLSRGGAHKGIDIAGALGSPIYAVDKGVVVKSYQSESYGNVIMLKHDNGYETVYAHLHAPFKNVGEVVEKGEQLGSMGNTGESTGVHLHFEVHHGEWNFGKENVIDPFLVFEEKPIGQQVFAFHPANGGAVTAAASAKNPAENLTHVVQKGDTLWNISQRYSTQIEKIKLKNKLENDLIVIGQKLMIDT